MSFIKYIKVFNDILDQFLEYLEDEFDDFKSDIILTRTGVEFIRRSNPRLVVEQFLTMITDVKQKIFDCDEDFFINFNMNTINATTDNFILHQKVKKIWLCESTTMEQKAHIWLYFQKLIKAGEKISNI